MRAKPSWTMLYLLASSGWISTNGSGRCAPSRWLETRARHGVPLVADASGVEPSGRDGPVSPRSAGTSGATKRPLPSLVKKPPSAKKRSPARLAFTCGPLHGLQGVEVFVGERGQRADIEVAAAIVLERRERGVLAENVGGGFVVKAVAEAQAFCGFADDPPVRPRLAGRRQERALARDAALGVGHGALLLAPGERGQQHVRTGIEVSLASTFSETTNSSSFFSASRTKSASGSD